jgi:ribonuclease P protein component
MAFARACPRALVARSWRAGDKRAVLAWRPDAPGFDAALVPRSTGFSSRQRLHTSKDFGRVFADPARSSDRYFTILARPNSRDGARLGLTISRRAAKKAVDRNKLKRLAREAFRMQQSLPAWDFVVLAKVGADRTDRRLLRESLDRLFTHLKAQASARRDA